MKLTVFDKMHNAVAGAAYVKEGADSLPGAPGGAVNLRNLVGPGMFNVQDPKRLPKLTNIGWMVVNGVSLFVVQMGKELGLLISPATFGPQNAPLADFGGYFADILEDYALVAFGGAVAGGAVYYSFIKHRNAHNAETLGADQLGEIVRLAVTFFGSHWVADIPKDVFTLDGMGSSDDPAERTMLDSSLAKVATVPAVLLGAGLINRFFASSLWHMLSTLPAADALEKMSSVTFAAGRASAAYAGGCAGVACAEILDPMLASGDDTVDAFARTSYKGVAGAVGTVAGLALWDGAAATVQAGKGCALTLWKQCTAGPVEERETDSLLRQQNVQGVVNP